MSLSDIVNVTISRDTQTLSVAGFGTINIVGPNLTGDKIQYFSTEDLAALAAALTNGDEDEEYIAAQAIAAQSPRPLQFAVSLKEADETYTQALDAIKILDNDWYGLIIVSRTASDVLLAAAWAEANGKVFATASANSRIVDTDYSTDDGTDEVADSLPAIFKARSYARSYCLYDEDAAVAYPDAGMLAVWLSRLPGSYTGMFKKITGATPSNLTPTYQKNALDKNCNIYETIGGINMVRESTSGEGEYFDVIHFIDWFQARLMEEVFGTLVRNDKVPYSPEGLVAIKSAIDAVGQRGIDAGGFTKKRFDADGNQVGGFYSIMPSIDSISANDKALRKLSGVRFKGFLSGAIHGVVINGNVVL